MSTGKSQIFYVTSVTVTEVTLIHGFKWQHPEIFTEKICHTKIFDSQGIQIEEIHLRLSFFELQIFTSSIPDFDLFCGMTHILPFTQ